MAAVCSYDVTYSRDLQLYKRTIKPEDSIYMYSGTYIANLYTTKSSV